MSVAYCERVGEWVSVCVLTQLLCGVDVLHVISVYVHRDDVGGAVGQARIQTGHWDKGTHTHTILNRHPHNHLEEHNVYF